MMEYGVEGRKEEENKCKVNKLFNEWDRERVNYIYILLGESISAFKTTKRKLNFIIRGKISDQSITDELYIHVFLEY